MSFYQLSDLKLNENWHRSSQMRNNCADEFPIWNAYLRMNPSPSLLSSGTVTTPFIVNICPFVLLRDISLKHKIAHRDEKLSVEEARH